MSAQRIDVSRFIVLRAPNQSLQGHARYDGVLDMLFEWQGQLAAHDGARAAARPTAHSMRWPWKLQLKSPWLATLNVASPMCAAQASALQGLSSSADATVGWRASAALLDGTHWKVCRCSSTCALASAAPALRDVQVDGRHSRPAADHLRAVLNWQFGTAPTLQGDGSLRLDARGLDLALDSAAAVRQLSLRARLSCLRRVAR